MKMSNLIANNIENNNNVRLTRSAKRLTIHVDFDDVENENVDDMEKQQQKNMKKNSTKKSKLNHNKSSSSSNNDNNNNNNNKEPDEPVMEPQNWKKIYDNIKKMRSETVAAVDTMGCDKCYDTEISEKQRRFQVLVALMLSSQTKDQITYAAMAELRKRNLSVDFIDEIPCEELAQLIKPVGFYRRKAEFLKRTAKILKDTYDGDIPSKYDELIKLPGVGPKMAHLVMKSAWNETTGIAVDTHVHRISNRFGWVKTKSPEQTMVRLERWLPKEYWNEFNHLLVGFGQTICQPVKPKCDECLNRKICPSSQYSF